MGRDGKSGKKRRSPLFRLIRAAIVATVSLFVLYVVAANVFLSTSLFEKVVRTGSVVIRFERAWSIFPQHVHVRKLFIRGQDSSLEWQVTLDQVELDISLASLLKRKFEGSHVRGKGISFRMRKRPDAPPSAEELATLPSIEGFPPYSVKPPKNAGPPDPLDRRWNDAAYHLWTLDLEDVVAKDVREVWVQHARFEGSARVDGRFYFKPIRAVEVGPLHVAVSSGRLSTDKGRVAEGFDGGTFDLTIAHFDPRTAEGADMLAGLSFASDAHVTFPEAARLPLPASLALEGPIELQRASLRVERGRVQKDSHLVVNAPNAVLTTARHRVTGAVTLEADVASGTDHSDRLELHAELSKAEVSHRSKPGKALRSILRAPKVLAVGDAGALELTRLLQDLHVVVDISDADVGSGGELSRYIPQNTPAAIANAGAKADLHVEAWLAEKRATGQADLRADHLDFRLAKMRVRGRAAVHLAFASYRFDTRRLDGAELKLRVSNGTLASTDAPNTPLVHLDAAELAASSPSVDLADPLRDLHASISVPSAEVVSRGLLHAYLPKGSEMQIASSRSRFALRIDVAVVDHLAKGTFDLQSKAFEVRYRDYRLDARVGLGARVHDWRWQTGDLALDDARVDIDGVTMAKAGAPAGMSIARIGLAAKSTHFKLGDPLSQVQLSAFFADARVSDDSTINSFLPAKAKYRFEGAEAAFAARVELAIRDHVATTGTLRASAASLGVGGEKVHLRGDIELVAEVADWDFHEDTMALRDAHFEMKGVTGRIGQKPGQSPDVSIARLLVATRSPSFDLGDPTLKRADFRLVVEKAELPDARALTPLLSPNSLLKIDSGDLHVDADVDVRHSQSTATGKIDIALTTAAVQLHETRMSGDFRFVAQLSGFDSEHRVLDLSGTRLEMRDIAISGATAKTSNWRGDISLPRASLRLGPEMMLDTTVRIDARDARPLLAIVFENDLPKIVLRITDVPHLDASARLVVAPHELGLLDLDARGGNFALRGSYATRNGHRQGGVIVKKAFISVGLKLDDDGAHLRLFRLKSWLRNRNCQANALLEMANPSCPPAPP
ncbi:MAG: hypothetical protein ACXVEF_39110 [Polyangiales bacterium]